MYKGILYHQVFFFVEIEALLANVFYYIIGSKYLLTDSPGFVFGDCFGEGLKQETLAPLVISFFFLL